MSGDAKSLEELVELAKQPDNDEAVKALLDRMENESAQTLRGASALFETLFEVWSDDVVHSEDKSNVCVKLAENAVLDSQNFRNALYFAVRKLLPPYLAGSSVIKSMGAKDASVSVRDTAMRLKKLQHLRSTAVMYQIDSHQWGRISSIDRVTGAIGFSAFSGSGVSSVPISSAIVTSLFFDTTPELMNLLYPSRMACKSSDDYRRVFHATSLSDVQDGQIKDVVQHLMVPSIMAQDAFEAWWNTAKPAVSATAGKRQFFDARSILELYTLLGNAEKEGTKISVDEAAAAKLAKVFGHVRPNVTGKDLTMLGECISIIAEAGTKEVITPVFAALRGRIGAFPATVGKGIPLPALDLWGKLPAKFLPGFIKAVSTMYSSKELAALAVLLPQRCIGPVFAAVEPADAREAIVKSKPMSSDLLLWIWKNKSTLPATISTIVDMDAVIKALCVEDLPKEWLAAQRDLKKSLLGKDDFQKYLIDNADADIPSIIDALQKYSKAEPGDRQTIMVKLARHSTELKDYIEGGEGKKMMGGDKSSGGTPAQAPLTSIASFKRLTNELEDLINRQIPDNAAAVALARSYGDLRENAEYDAAKERRRYLHRRRAELEKTLSFIQGTDFKDVVVKEHAVLGSKVVLENDKGEKKEFYLLGAWDGDPEKNRISYKTRAGEAILDKKVGDKVEIPESGVYTLVSVSPLPEDLRKELAAEK